MTPGSRPGYRQRACQPVTNVLCRYDARGPRNGAEWTVGTDEHLRIVASAAGLDLVEGAAATVADEPLAEVEHGPVGKGPPQQVTVEPAAVEDHVHLVQVHVHALSAGRRQLESVDAADHQLFGNVPDDPAYRIREDPGAGNRRPDLLVVFEDVHLVILDQ